MYCHKMKCVMRVDQCIANQGRVINFHHDWRDKGQKKFHVYPGCRDCSLADLAVEGKLNDDDVKALIDRYSRNGNGENMYSQPLEGEEMKEQLEDEEMEVRSCTECGEEFFPYQRGYVTVKRLCPSCLNHRMSVAQTLKNAAARDNGGSPEEEVEHPIMPPMEERVQHVDLVFCLSDYRDQDLYQKIAGLADVERRTIEQQILFLLEKKLGV